jgi:hypothetical protein
MDLCDFMIVVHFGLFSRIYVFYFRNLFLMSVPKRKSSSRKASAKKQKNLVDELNSARDDYRSSLMSQTFLESSNNDLPYSRTRSQKNSTKNSSPSVTSSISLPSATNSASPLLTTDPISKSINPNTSSRTILANFGLIIVKN